MNADEVLLAKQRQFARDQVAAAKALKDKCGAYLLEKYGAEKYFAWETATKKAGTR